MFCVHPNSTETPVVFQDVNPAQTRSGKAPRSDKVRESYNCRGMPKQSIREYKNCEC